MKCRFCGSASGDVSRVSLDRTAAVLGARDRRMARIPVGEHAGCRDAAEATHERFLVAYRAKLAEAAEAARAGDVERAVALTEESAGMQESDYAGSAS